jgi:hypothetical protein
MKCTLIAITAAAFGRILPARPAEIVVTSPAGGFANGVLASALAKALPGDRVVLRAREYRLDGHV